MEKQKRILSKMLDILVISILPLFWIVIIVVMFAERKVESNVHSQLETANIQLNDYVLHNLIDELPTLYESDGKDYSYVDSLLGDGIVMTVFYDDTCVISSVKDDSEKRMEGTKASDVAIETCLNGGNHYASDDTIINGSTYFADYLPIKDTNGKIVGMSFAGMKSKTVNATIWNTTLKMLFMGVLCIPILFEVIVYLAAHGKLYGELYDELHDEWMNGFHKFFS